MTVDAIIFDFDGVIIDTETPDYESWRELFETERLELPIELWLQRVGINEVESFSPVTHYEKLTGRTLGDDFKSRQWEQYLDRCAKAPLLDGVEALIREANKHGIKLAVASSSYREWVEPRLRQHHLLQYFDCLRTRDDVQKGKPAPDLYISAAECLGMAIERCIAIEDSPNGMKAALAAGMRCIAVPNQLTNRLTRPEVSLTVTSLAECTLDRILTEF
jgi:HAD superfamily hydrolase (TIGR01509 family)